MQIQNSDKIYHNEHSIVYSCQYHVVFCPKYRRSVLVDGIDVRLKELIVEKQQEYLYTILDLEIMPDHVHLILDVDPRLGVADIVGKIKGYTAHTLRSEFPSLKSRLPNLWTRSKFISSVGTVSLDIVKRYIEHQKNV